jgi:predicted transglutaminase-like cysteine proteinase
MVDGAPKFPSGDDGALAPVETLGGEKAWPDPKQVEGQPPWAFPRLEARPARVIGAEEALAGPVFHPVSVSRWHGEQRSLLLRIAHEEAWHGHCFIEIILVMIQISLNPFVLRRIFFVLLALMGLSCASAYGESLLIKVKSTPYDRQMTRILPVLLTDGQSEHDQVSLRLVNQWIGDLRSIPYGFTRVWKTPAETQSGEPADCKAKAVALYERMKEHGVSDVRLVIGRRTSMSHSTHAWVEWETEGGNYVLDPTINWMAYRSSDLGSRAYIPYYAFAGSRKYRAAQTTLVAQN